MHVHISNLAAQTGASLFLHRRAPPFFLPLASPPSSPVSPSGRQQEQEWTYNKTEGLTLAALAREPRVTHVIAEYADVLGATTATTSALDVWAPEAVIDGFAGWRVDWEVLKVRARGAAGTLQGLGRALEMVRTPQLVIMKRKGR